MCIVQLYVPASMIFQNEKTIAQGEEFKFKTVPVDPNDPFRGKYIRLNFDANQYDFKEDLPQLEEMNEIYVILEKDEQGFAKIETIVFEPPYDDRAYIRLSRSNWYRLGIKTPQITIEYPFNRFYLEESKAPDAERLYFEALRDSQLSTYAQVYVSPG